MITLRRLVNVAVVFAIAYNAYQYLVTSDTLYFLLAMSFIILEKLEAIHNALSPNPPSESDDV